MLFCIEMRSTIPGYGVFYALLLFAAHSVAIRPTTGLGLVLSSCRFGSHPGVEKGEIFPEVQTDLGAAARQLTNFPKASPIYPIGKNCKWVHLPIFVRIHAVVVLLEVAVRDGWRVCFFIGMWTL